MHFRKKYLKLIRLFSNIFCGVDSEENHEYTLERNYLKPLTVSNLFRDVYFENNHEYTLRNFFFEAIQLGSKIFLGIDFEKSHEYTFKNTL